MQLRLSRFVHMLPVGADRVLIVHALTHMRLVIDRELAEMLLVFQAPREVEEGGFAPLVERGILVEKDADEEVAEVARELGQYYGRDPVDIIDQLRRASREGGTEAYWAAGHALTKDDLAAEGRPRLDVLLFGDCDVHMEAEFLRREAANRGIDLRVAATFPDDLRLAAERRHDAILIGALRARHGIIEEMTPDQPVPPYVEFVGEAQFMVDALRKVTQAPILIDLLPEPTVQPLGMADRGLNGHRNRFRLANLALAQIGENHPDVHVVDTPAVLAAAGSTRMLDDGEVGYTHFGAPGWLLQRTEAEKAALHGIGPDLSRIAHAVDADPYGREAVMARAHLDALMTVTGLDRKKCVIVDLDGVLWPGVLAETGAPFAWSQEVSSPFSFVGLYFGLHEALLALKKRGVLLACVSKNDEETVRRLWTYEDHYPRQRLLTPDDFVTWRVNWKDKVENIASIAEELGFALSSFVFIDDRPDERERVRQRLPEVEVWGEDLTGLRRRLLSDPRLQTPRLTAESAARTEATKAQLGRALHRADTPDESQFLASLNVQTVVERVGPGARLDRVEELFQRTTQFNTTAIKPSVAQLEALLQRADAAVFTLRVCDRFGDHGLVGAAVVVDGEILGLVLSCRVLGLGVEKTFLQAVVDALDGEIVGRIIASDRNGPARHIYADLGFTDLGEGVWRLARAPERARA